MKINLRLTRVVGSGLLIAAISACSSAPIVYADTSSGRRLNAEMCESMRSFTRASLDAEGLRRAWFLPFEALSLYAPMASLPSDDASMAFYGQRVGQLTHYVIASTFAQALASCLDSKHGYARTCRVKDEESFHASFLDRTAGRSIEISEGHDITGVLIADKLWKGDVGKALMYKGSTENELNGSPMTTCLQERDRQ